MTNAMIVLLKSVDLMEQGILQPTGKKMIVEMADGNKEYDIPEPIHTYQKWKELGYQVKKGEKAVAQFPIWKYTKKKSKDMTEEEAQQQGYCFMKQSSWFTGKQVQQIKEDK